MATQNDPGPALGWIPENEEQHAEELVNIALAYGALPCSLPAESAIPADMIPDWFLQRVQGSWGFCHAFMRTGIVRALYWLSTKGQTVDFSPYFAAITDLRMDGNDTVPGGASIGGSLRGSIKYGEALETLLPYPADNARYSNKIPANVMEDASHRHIKSIVPGIRSYAALDAAQVSGHTAIGFGMNWYTGEDAIRGVDTIKTNPATGRLRGGHALMFFGWKTIAGERWPLLHNSHLGWGETNKRRAFVNPKVVDAWLKNSQFGAFGVTNLDIGEIVQNEPWDWVTASSFKSGNVDPFV